MSISKFNNDIKMINSKDTALTLLIHLGYLSYDGEGLCRIPNYEIKNEMLNNLTDSENSPFSNMIKLSTEAVDGLFNNNVEAINKALSENHKKLATIYNKNNESVLGYIVGVTFLRLTERYIQLQEVNSTTGRADIVYIPKGNNPLIIVELKVDKDTLTVVERAKNKGYVNTLGDYHGKVYIVGINYDNKTLEHSTLIEKIEI